MTSSTTSAARRQISPSKLKVLKCKSESISALAKVCVLFQLDTVLDSALDILLLAVTESEGNDSSVSDSDEEESNND